MLLLDTHIVLWLAHEQQKISSDARQAIADARIGGEILSIASATLWEIALLRAKGRIMLGSPIDVFLAKTEMSFQVLGMDAGIAILGNAFSKAYPSDPADRQIGATAVGYGLTLVTADRKIRDSSEVPCIW